MKAEEAAPLEEERKHVLLGRLEDLRKKKRRLQLSGALSISLGMFLLLVSWVVLGFTLTYLVVGAVGSALVGMGLYLLVMEPTTGPWLTLADELEEAVHSVESPADLRRRVEEALGRHPDERVLGNAVREALLTAGDDELRERLREILRAYFGQG